jgi:hypothetical protein
MLTVLRNKYVLVTLVIAFLILLFISPYIAYIRVYNHVTDTSWDRNLLYMAGLAMIINLLPYLHTRLNLKRIKFLAGLFTVAIFIWVYKDYGFLNGAFFMSAYYLIRLLITKILFHRGKE